MPLPNRIALAFASTACACTFAYAAPADQHPPLDRARIEQLTGLKGTFSERENVFKVSKPRTDVPVQVDGVAMAPFMGLTSWAAFTPMNDGHVMLMGDTVVFEDEVNPAMSAALDAGLEVTALHNHFFFDRPKVYFMHIGGMGDAATLAAGVKKVYDKIAEIRAANAAPAMNFPGKVGVQNTITPAPLESILGTKGQGNNGMFKVVVGASGSMHGTPIGNEMGVNTWAAFAGTDDEAVVDGDLVMRENELQPVLKSMRGDGINIVAIHQHMTAEQPRYMFLHYWGKGHADTLAHSVRRALDAQAAVKK
ncbi:hypothetical protein LMG6871_02700 [Ralstonia edaphis]|uniref:DUF1259 domain-containing protein n=1 Tax=Ralstonia edaphi TaxID=3058599 RepID=UPI0028F5A641|nr:DUF1259 domain-containing protein [Ralstonia sp. LMG 6871]CAJ0719131.1 hypothetical protein LMG6871_02700 [Ralstonia sp. LMG 6871]